MKQIISDIGTIWASSVALANDPEDPESQILLFIQGLYYYIRSKMCNHDWVEVDGKSGDSCCSKCEMYTITER